MQSFRLKWSQLMKLLESLSCSWVNDSRGVRPPSAVVRTFQIGKPGRRMLIVIDLIDHAEMHKWDIFNGRQLCAHALELCASAAACKNQPHQMV